MGQVKKLSVSFDGDVAERVHHYAKRSSGGNVSAWLQEAALDRIRRLEAREAVEEWEREHGEITDAELNEVLGRWFA